MTVILSVSFGEGSGERLAGTSELPGSTGYGVIRSMSAEPLAHGMRPGQPVWSSTVLRGVLYFTNGIARLRSWDGRSVTPASPEKPAMKPTFHVERTKVRVKGLGASAPDEEFGTAGTGRVTAATTLSNLAGWEAEESDIGKTLVVPSTYLDGGPDYIGTIASINSPTSIEVSPAFDATQQPGAGQDIAFSVFEKPLADIEPSTPYHARRLVPQGGNSTLATREACPAGEENEYAFRSAGGCSLVIRGARFEKLDRDVVVDWKAYIYPYRVEAGTGGRSVLVEARADQREAGYEVSVVEGGKLEFRIWNTATKRWAGVRTIGRVLSPREWHYVRVRYRFKAGGGWQPDLRHVQRLTTDIHVAGRHRDGIWCYNVEGRDPADPLLVVPGSHQQHGFDPSGASNLWAGRSWEPANLALPVDRPEIGPRYGEPGYWWPAAFVTAAPASSWALTVNATAAGPAVDPGTTFFTCTMRARAAAPVGPELVLSRTYSRNRDVGTPTQAVGGQIATQDIGTGNPNFYPGVTTGPLAAGIPRTRALLVHVYGEAVNNVAAEFAVANRRVLALVSVGTNDIGNVSVGGTATSTCVLSDDPRLGGDGLGALAAPLGTGVYLVSLQVPNGRNHATQATGNTTPFPLLVEQTGDPIGVDDSPTNDALLVRLMGSRGEGVPERGVDGFDGVIDDPCLSIKPLAALTETGTYSSDHLPPDVQWRGPVDARLYSLPPLARLASGVVSDIAAGQNYADADWASTLDAPVRGTIFAADLGVAPAVFDRTDQRIPYTGKVQLAVAYRDPDQNREGPLSDTITIEAEKEPDEDPTDAGFSVRLEGIPVSGDRSRARLHRVIFRSLPGGVELQREAELCDNRAGSYESNPNLAWLATRTGRLVGSGEPPICTSVTADESRLWFGGIADAPNAVAWSEPDRGWSSPGNQRRFLEGRSGQRVRALGNLLGRVFAFQENAIFALALDFAGLVARRVTSSVGCAGAGALVEADDALYVMGLQGLYAIDTGLRPMHVGAAFEGLLKAGDRTMLGQTSAAYDPVRRHVAMIWRDSRRAPARRVLLLEIPNGSLDTRPAPAASLLHYDEGIACLGTVMVEGQPEFIVGTALGTLGRVAGSSRGRLAATPTNVLTIASGDSVNLTMSASPSGPTNPVIAQGTPVVFTREIPYTCPDGSLLTVRRVVGRGAVLRTLTESGIFVLSLAEPVTGLQVGDRAELGAKVSRLVSGIQGVRNGSRQTHVLAVDLIYPPGSGTLGLEMLVDRAASPSIAVDVDLSTPGRLTSPSVRGAFLQFRLESLADINLLAARWRVELETQHG